MLHEWRNVRDKSCVYLVFIMLGASLSTDTPSSSPRWGGRSALGPTPCVVSGSAYAPATGSGITTSPWWPGSRSGSGSWSSGTSMGSPSSGAVISIMTSSSTFITFVIWVKRSPTSWPWGSPSTKPRFWSYFSSGMFYSNSWTTNCRSIHSTNCIISISGVFIFNKGKTCRIPCNPDIPQSAVIFKCPFQIFFTCIATQVTNINFAL